MIGTSVMKGLESPGIRQVSIKWFILLVNVDISVYGYNHETFCNTTVTKTAQKMKFSIKEFFTKSRSFLRIWSHLLKKSLLENFIFCALKVFARLF